MKKITTILLIILIVLIIIIIITVYSILGQTNQVEIEKSDEALGISIMEEIGSPENIVVSKPENRNDIVNILLFGLDRTDPNENSRSDSIIIMTVDFKNKKIKLTSLMRDMFVNIEGYGNTKLNHAYSYGGAPLAIKTINQNFGTTIRDYIAIDYLNLEKAIDILGGINIDIKSEEVAEMNVCFSDVEIVEAGEQLLNGNQAVAYSRIRYIGNGDFERTDRQRNVLFEIFNKAKNMEITSIFELVSEILPLVETSMDRQTIVDVAMDYFKVGNMTFDEERFPIDGYYWNDMTEGIYYLKFDADITKQQIIDYIFNDVKPIQKK